ncbi:MAG: hypothetical protein V2A73_19745 [Pseudomonadota bacterium]
MHRLSVMQSDNGQEVSREGAPGIAEAARRVRTDVSALGQAIAQKSDDLGRTVGGFCKDRPVVSVAIAFAAGYVLGGGLFSRVTSRLVVAGMRMGGVAIAKNLLGTS